MWIRGLEKFLRDSIISEEVDIRLEIEQWRCEHGTNPTIIIDVRQLLRIFFRIDDDSLFIGGRYEKFNEILEYFFKQMKQANTDLMFIVELNEGKWKDVNNFRLFFRNYDHIKEKKTFKFRKCADIRIDSSLFPTERILYNSLRLLLKYGPVSVYYGLGKGAILAFARENKENVMALITRNTEILVHDDEFQYWSLSGVNFYDLKIARFSRQKLNDIFKLNVQQMQLFLAISKLWKWRLKIRSSEGSPEWHRLATEYVKEQKYGPNGYESSQLTGDLTEEDRNTIQKKLEAVMLMTNYSGNWKEDRNEGLILDLVNNDPMFNLVLQFFKENIYFAYKMAKETLTIQKDLLFIDIRRPDALPFIDLVIEMTMKMIGVIFKDVQADKQPKTRTVKIGRVFEEEAIETEMDVIYPLMPLPELKDLIIEEDDNSFDESRWSLLEWLLDLSKESISKVNNSKKELRIVLLTLKFLLTHEIITAREADVILVTELDARTKGNVYVPRHFCPPPPMPDNRFPKYVDIAWVQVAHKYTITFELICHCLELCGLRRETDLILMRRL